MMNERIEQLIKQSYVERDSGDGTWFSKEKFAELIQEDMYRKVIASILITDVVMEEKGQVPTSEDYILAINKDFGVEE